MARSTHTAPVRLRATALWLVLTAALAGVGVLCRGAAGDLMASPAPDFGGLLEQGCAASALLAIARLWLLTTHVAITVVRNPDRPVERRVGPARALLLAACGVAALGSTTTAVASPGAPATPPLPDRILAGLPLPDRATTELPSAAHGAPVVRVRPGDSLWRIAARRLGRGASAADVASYWRRVHRLNDDVVGPDPDLVLPGQVLELPPAPPSR